MCSLLICLERTFPRYWFVHIGIKVIMFHYQSSCIHTLTYLDTWSGFESAKTVLWQSLRLRHSGKFLEPSDELAGRGCCCFLMRWHSWAFLAHQKCAVEICPAQIWHFPCPSDILATSCTTEAQIQLSHFLEGIVLCFCLLDTE